MTILFQYRRFLNHLNELKKKFIPFDTFNKTKGSTGPYKLRLLYLLKENFI